jgi:hypothetical protein
MHRFFSMLISIGLAHEAKHGQVEKFRCGAHSRGSVRCVEVIAVSSERRANLIEPPMPINESEKLAEPHMKRVVDRNVAINVQDTGMSSPERKS